MPSPNRRIGIVLAVGGMLLISLDSLLIRLSEVGSWDVAFWVGVFAFGAISAVLAVRRESIVGVIRRDGLPLVVSALLSAGSLTLFIASIGQTRVANTVAIVATTPVVAAVVAWVVIDERPSPRTWFAIVGSVAGVLAIVAGSVGAGSVAGDLLAVVAVLLFAGNVTVWRRYPQISRRGIIGLSGLLVAMLAVVPADPLAVGGRALAILAVMGAVTGPLGRIGLAMSTRHLPAAQVGLITPVETVAATAWAWIFLHEPPPLATAIGGLVVVASVAFGAAQRPLARRTLHRT